MKKKFETPEVKISKLMTQELLITASPGIGGEFTEGMVIESKGRSSSSSSSFSAPSSNGSINWD